MAPSGYQLRVTSGPDLGAACVLTDGVSRVGRSLGADLPLSEVSAARSHFELRRDPAGRRHVVRVYGLNGLEIGGIFVPAGSEPIALNEEAVLDVGATSIRYERVDL